MWAIIILLALSVFYFNNEKVSHALSAPVVAIFRPALESRSGILGWFSQKITSFKEKNYLVGENKKLQERALELEINSNYWEEIRKENEELKKIIIEKTGDSKEYLYAEIIQKPPFVSYDTLIVNKGAIDNVSNGQLVTAYGKVLLGRVEEVFEKSAKVKLISFYKEETIVNIPSLSLTSTISGRGGENMIMNLPKDLIINTGENVVSKNLLVGVIEKIETDDNSPFQKIILRLPLNIQNLSFVAIEKVK